MRGHRFRVVSPHAYPDSATWHESRLILPIHAEKADSRQSQLDPLVSLHFYAPVCAVVNLCILPWLEGLAPFYALHRVGIVVLLSNAATAFALNVGLYCEEAYQQA